jgi:toxin HigB-1
MIKTFKDEWLEDYYFDAVQAAQIPVTIESALKRKLDIVHAAHGEPDLRIPPGNRFERLSGKLQGWCSIRVNKQYRLIFQWGTGGAAGVYLDPHTYK